MFIEAGIPIYTKDRFNNNSSAIYLNSPGAYLRLPDGVYLTNDFTLLVWVKVHSWIIPFQRIFNFDLILFSLNKTAK